MLGHRLVPLGLAIRGRIIIYFFDFLSRLLLFAFHEYLLDVYYVLGSSSLTTLNKIYTVLWGHKKETDAISECLVLTLSTSFLSLAGGNIL